MKKIVVNVSGSDDLFRKAVKLGVNSFVADKPLHDFETYVPSGDGYQKFGEKHGVVPRIMLRSPRDLELVVEQARKGVDEVVIATGDWKIIPIENLLAMLQGFQTRVLAEVGSVSEAELFINILEKGVDGVVAKASSENELKILLELFMKPAEVKLVEAVVEEVRDVGVGDRACVDTVTMMELGEGMLVGSKAYMFFLVHNEAVGSSFTSPRPFRVNAGAVHSYVLMPNGTTRYISELESGDRVLIVSRTGRSRIASIGRVKIERRPLRLVKAKVDDVVGTITVQNAETIRFVKPDGQLISVTELKKDDKILCYVSEARGRHFGMAVEETVIEK